MYKPIWRRDKTGHEIDLLIERGLQVLPLEIKSSMTYHTDFSASLKWWLRLPGNETRTGIIVYDGLEPVGTSSALPCIPWKQLDLFTEHDTFIINRAP